MLSLNLKIIIISLLQSWLFNYIPALACTAFMLQDQEKVLVGKNLDWPIGDGFIVINKRDVSKLSMVQKGDLPVHWVSKYGSITFNQFGQEFPLGGMNEAGLVIEELSLAPAEFPSGSSLPAINEFQWIQYQLDNFKNVAEVVRHLPHIKICRLMEGLHYFICDSSGDCAVVEFIEGKILLYRGANLPVPVLSNNAYKNAMNYVYRFEGFGGECKIENRQGSQERFLRAAALIRNYYPEIGLSGLAYAFKILDDVRQQDTQWQIVYEPQTKQIAFRFHNNSRKHSIRFANVDFSEGHASEIIRISDDISEEDILPGLRYGTPQLSRMLLQKVFAKLIFTGEVDKESAYQIQTSIYQYLLNLEKVR